VRYLLHHKGLSSLGCVEVANPSRIRPLIYFRADLPPDTLTEGLDRLRSIGGVRLHQRSEAVPRPGRARHPVQAAAAFECLAAPRKEQQLVREAHPITADLATEPTE
jgi:hypothetical protein